MISRVAACLTVFALLSGWATEASSGDSKVEFCGSRNRTPDGVGVSVLAFKRQAGDDSLVANIVISRETPIPNSSSFPVMTGDPILWDRTIYRVSAIYYDKPGRDRLEMFARQPVSPTGLEARDCVTLTPEAKGTSFSETDLVLPKWRSLPGMRLLKPVIFFTSGSTSDADAFSLILEGVNAGGHNGDVASIAWQAGERSSWNQVGLGSLTPDLAIHRIDVRAGDEFSLLRFGKFKAVRVIPEGPHQPAWLVIERQEPEGARSAH